MPFGKSAALSARGVGTYPARVLRLDNHGDAAAVEIAVIFTGALGEIPLLTAPIPTLLPGGVIELPLRQFRRHAVIRLHVHWTAENGATGEFFGVLTAGQ